MQTRKRAFSACRLQSSMHNSAPEPAIPGRPGEQGAFDVVLLSAEAVGMLTLVSSGDVPAPRGPLTCDRSARLSLTAPAGERIAPAGCSPT